MKTCIVLLSGFLLVAPGVVGSPVTSQAMRRTPVRCSYDPTEWFHFGQDTLLVTSQEGQLFRAEGATWQVLPTPTGWGGERDKMSIAPDGTIYLLDQDTYAIYRSKDRGGTWQQSGQAPSTPESISDLSASPVQDLIFLGAFSQIDSAISRSEDGGATWERVLGGGREGISFSPDFPHDGLVLAAAWGKGIFDVWRSLDRGQTWAFEWRSIDSPWEFRGVIAFSPQFAEDRTAFTDQVGGEFDSLALYKTTDGGVSWFKVNNRRVSGPPAFSPDYIHDQTFIVGQDSRLVLSQDGGRTLAPIWDQADGDAEVWGVRRQDPIAQSPLPPPSQGKHRYYFPLMLGGPPPLEFWLVAQEAASGCYLYRSRDYGVSWEEIAVP